MKKINLTKRLLKCAEAVTPGEKIADIGTDHAYIPVYLALNGLTPYALACDVRSGPLENAKSNVKKYNLEKIIETRISDGFENIKENEADEIIIAGMGGNMISNILENCRWKNKQSKKFILQPMKYEEKLRVFLAQNGYETTSENAVVSLGKVYTVINAVYTGNCRELKNGEEKFIGKISKNITPDAKAYIRKQIKNLLNLQKGAKSKNVLQEYEYYSQIIENLKKLLSSEVS